MTLLKCAAVATATWFICMCVYVHPTPNVKHQLSNIDHALTACQDARMHDCHAELDTDGSISVYGRP